MIKQKSAVLKMYNLINCKYQYNREVSGVCCRNDVCRVDMYNYIPLNLVAYDLIAKSAYAPCWL